MDTSDFVFFSFLEFPIPTGIELIRESGLGGELHMVCIFFIVTDLCI